eukprot:284817841_5
MKQQPRRLPPKNQQAKKLVKQQPRRLPPKKQQAKKLMKQQPRRLQPKKQQAPRRHPKKGQPRNQRKRNRLPLLLKVKSQRSQDFQGKSKQNSVSTANMAVLQAVAAVAIAGLAGLGALGYMFADTSIFSRRAARIPLCTFSAQPTHSMLKMAPNMVQSTFKELMWIPRPDSTLQFDSLDVCLKHSTIICKRQLSKKMSQEHHTVQKPEASRLSAAELNHSRCLFCRRSAVGLLAVLEGPSQMLYFLSHFQSVQSPSKLLPRLHRSPSALQRKGIVTVKFLCITKNEHNSCKGQKDSVDLPLSDSTGVTDVNNALMISRSLFGEPIIRPRTLAVSGAANEVPSTAPMPDFNLRVFTCTTILAPGAMRSTLIGPLENHDFRPLGLLEPTPMMLSAYPTGTGCPSRARVRGNPGCLPSAENRCICEHIPKSTKPSKPRNSHSGNSLNSHISSRSDLRVLFALALEILRPLTLHLQKWKTIAFPLLIPRLTFLRMPSRCLLFLRLAPRLLFHQLFLCLLFLRWAPRLLLH